MPFSKDLPNPGIEPRSPRLQADSLPSEPPEKPVSEAKICKANKRETEYGNKQNQILKGLG